MADLEPKPAASIWEDSANSMRLYEFDCYLPVLGLCCCHFPPLSDAECLRDTQETMRALEGE